MLGSRILFFCASLEQIVLWGDEYLTESIVESFKLSLQRWLLHSSGTSIFASQVKAWLFSFSW